MENRILVTYATRKNSTAEVAQSIAETLHAAGQTVDLYPVKAVHDVSHYDAVVIGSAIRFGRWLPEAVNFVSTNRESLSRVPVSYFTVCITLSDDSDENRATVQAYLDPVRSILKPVREGWFAGRLDYSRIDWWQRRLGKAIRMPEGDFRNWDAIRAWATSVL